MERDNKKNYGIKELTLYRRDFRDPTGEVDFFDDLLNDLDIPKDQRDNIDEIDLEVDCAGWDNKD